MRYSCAQLARFQLPGYPKTRQGWDKLVKENRWEFVELPGKGRGGLRREYLPSEDVLTLIKMLKNDGAPPPASSKKLMMKVRARKPNVTSGFDELPDQQSEWAEISIRLALIIRNNQMLAKAQNKTHEQLSLMAFRCIYMFCEGSVISAKLWLDNALNADKLVQFVYEGFCNGKNVDPKSNVYINPPISNFAQSVSKSSPSFFFEHPNNGRQ